MYDAIVVGARCAGSPTAMLLARKGYRVLLVDRATFPSDTISTHYIWPPGVACLKRWGLWERVLTTGCPPIRGLGFDPGAFQLFGEPPVSDGVAEMCCPRRTVLDKLLLDAAAEAGAEVREGYRVTGFTSADGRITGVRGHERGRPEVEERARIVVGADGLHSLLAKTVRAPEYKIRGVLACQYYTYWAGVPSHTVTIRARPRRLMGSAPTNDGLTMVTVAFPHAEFKAVRADPERHWMAAIDMAPELAELLRAGRRVERFAGSGDIPNFFRKPFGEGWALVGDAGYHKDPCTAQGITDAFCSAELLAQALDAGLSSSRPLPEALAEYQRARDEHFTPMFELTCGFATLEPPPPEVQALYQALRSNQAETDRFLGTIAGTVSIPEYYAPENLQRIVAAAARASTLGG